MAVWNGMMDTTALAIEANDNESELSLKALETISDTTYYKDLVAEARKALDAFVVDFINAKINSVSVPEEVITLKKSELNDMLTSMKKDIMKELAPENSTAKAIEALAKAMKLQTNDGKFAEHEEFDPTDVLAEPVIFFTYSIGFGIMDDSKNGRPISTPYKRPIHFVHLFRYEKMGRHRKEYINISTAKITSKKEAEWMRKHSLFNIKFFEDICKVKDIDVFMQDKLVEANYEVGRLSDHEVVSRARVEKEITMTADISQMRKELIFVIAKKRLEQSGRKSTEMVHRTEEEKKKISNAGV